MTLNSGRKWMAVILSGGVLLSLESCAADVGYLLLDAFVDYLPDLLDAWLETVAESA